MRTINPYFSAIVFPLFLLLAACSNGRDAQEESESVLNRGLSVEPESLDPHRHFSNSAAKVLRDIGEGLLTYSASGTLTGGVASSWNISDDGIDYIFEIRQDAKWSNGDPLTSGDFVFALRRLVSPDTASPYAEILKPIRNAEQILRGEIPPNKLAVFAIDQKTLRIELSTPTPYFVQLLTHPSAFPLHANSVRILGDKFSRPGSFISNGAYELKERNVGSSIELTRNRNYWRDSATGFDRVTYHVVQESAEIDRFRAGELDITANVDGSMFKAMLQERPDELKVAPYLGTYYYGFNLNNEPFSENLDLRRALSMAVDREGLVEVVTGRGEEPAYGWVPHGIDGYKSQSFDYLSLTKKERENEARRIYKKAGYDSDNPVRFELRYNTSVVQTRIALAVQSMWREVLGAEVTLVNEEFRVLLSNIQSMEMTEMFRLSWTGDYNDPYAFLQLFETGNPSNLTGFANSNVDELLEAAASEADEVVRMSLLADAEAAALVEHPVIPLYFYVSKHLVRESVEGWQDNVLDFHYSQHLRPRP